MTVPLLGLLERGPSHGYDREHGTAVILVTHDAQVAAYADREVIVRDGKISTLTGAVQ